MEIFLPTERSGVGCRLNVKTCPSGLPPLSLSFGLRCGTAHIPATGRSLCLGSSAGSIWSKRNKSSVPAIAKTWALVTCNIIRGSGMLICFAAPSMCSHLCSHEAAPCCCLGWLRWGTGAAVLFLEGWSASSSLSLYIQRSTAGYVSSLLFLINVIYVMELF